MSIGTAVIAPRQAEWTGQKQTGILTRVGRLTALRGIAASTVERRRHPDEVIAAELAQNARTWAALQRLGVEEGAELPLAFFFETAGAEADRELAEFLRSEAGYEIVTERDGLTGFTGPMKIGPAELDDWVRKILYAGYAHGGCVFAGWTATVTVAPVRKQAPVAV